MTQTWTDGSVQVAQCDRVVSVQVLGDRYVTVYEDADEAAAGFAYEVSVEQTRAAAVGDICRLVEAQLAELERDHF